MENLRLLIVTGMSGAGKTKVMQTLEDMGYFCIDNIPPKLIPKFAELCRQNDERISRTAMVVDIRGGEFFKPYQMPCKCYEICKFLTKWCLLKRVIPF